MQKKSLTRGNNLKSYKLFTPSLPARILRISTTSATAMASPTATRKKLFHIYATLSRQVPPLKFMNHFVSNPDFLPGY
jgi:hypothetical protein